MAGTEYSALYISCGEDDMRSVDEKIKKNSNYFLSTNYAPDTL